MSNQFSYELDERQIRIMLRDGEAENDPAAWSRFEQLAQPDVKSKQASLGPRFNISISRSVLVPAIFVALIGGLSATLFSFVDFKKKDIKVTKNTLKPENPNTPANITQAVKTPDATPEKSVSVPAEKIAATPTPTVQQPTLVQTETTTPAQKTETRPAETAPAKTVIAPVITASRASAPTLSGSAVSNSTTQQAVLKKRKQKKVVSEEIPTINTSSTNLNQESQEPELELR